MGGEAKGVIQEDGGAVSVNLMGRDFHMKIEE